MPGGTERLKCDVKEEEPTNNRPMPYESNHRDAGFAGVWTIFVTTPSSFTANS